MVLRIIILNVAKDSEFTNILKDYNNKSIGDVDNFKVVHFR